MLPEILAYAAFAAACWLAAAADGLLARHLTRNTPTGQTAGCAAECDGWDGYGPY